MKTPLFTFATVLLLMSSFSLWAKHVEPEDAAIVGKNYYWEQCQRSVSLNYDQVNLTWFATKKVENTEVFHIFNVGRDLGFVIVSADDEVVPVLGYSNSGCWSGQNIPPALLQLLNHYARQISALVKNDWKGNREVSEQWAKYLTTVPEAPKTRAVTPLLTTNWDQGKYYNNQCPQAVLGPDGHVYAGCAAVSMAQVIKYHQHPATGFGSNTYSHPTYGQLSANFGTTSYNYASMPNQLFNYNASVAQLMYQCGVAIDMNYGPNGSAPGGTYWDHDILKAMIINFGYSNTSFWQWKSLTDSLTWISMLKTELNQGRPLIYYGWDGAGTAHNFNCDGYDNQNRFHMNWGWSGQCNGYYYLFNLIPTGTGYNFSYEQGAIFGLYPTQHNFDFGDAPDNPGYPTLITSNGACHKVHNPTCVYLGSSVDCEPDGQPHVNCIGDDTDILYPPVNDDEDGVAFPATVYQNQSCIINVAASCTGYLNGWIDYNQDGDWYDTGEQVLTNYNMVAGNNSITIQIPASANIGWNYARFRFSTFLNVGVTGPAIDGEVEDYFFRIEEDPGQGSSGRSLIFSVDIGSDSEMSDPMLDGNEALDPGDAYLSPGTFIPMPGGDGIIDDISGFGIDPFPDGGIPGTGAPCLCGMPIQNLVNDFFDMDGIDLTLCDLREFPFGEGMPPVEQFEDAFIHNADSMYISYDDDDFMPYPDPTGSIPRLGFSSTGMLYGQSQTMDEILEVDINITYPLSGQIMAINPKYDEASIHPNLAPNPDINAPIPNEYDDDVDALDAPANLEDVTHTYFTADHEAASFDHAGNPINPGSIYLADNGQAFEVINAQTDIGLMPETDIDAFEFTWIEYPDPDYNYMSLAMIFSVDEDDPTTPGDESGGLMPNALYVTWMTGWWFDLVVDGFMDDIDAITIVPVVGTPDPKADFSPNNTTIFAGQHVVFNDLSTGNPTSWSWTFNGGNPATFNGSTPPGVIYNNPGTYQVSLTVANAQGSDTKTGTVHVMPQNWQYAATNVSHIISVPLSANPTVNGAPLSSGDLIGVFFTDLNGNETCGGYGVWDGVNNVSVVAYGDDLTTPQKDGFVNGELLTWKVYRWSSFSACTVNVTYDQSLPNYDGNYQDFGISALLSLNTFSMQTINLYKGWNGLSAFLNPVDKNIVNMMSPVSNELIILQNMTGVYWPAAGVNTLNTWDTASGFIAKVSQDAVLPVTGSPLVSRILTLTPGWHIIPMLSSTAMSTSTLFNMPQVMLVKEIAGSGVYWPSMGINTLSVVQPGRSYYVFATSAVTINFPAKSAPAGEIKSYGKGNGESPWPVVNPTPGSHLVGVSETLSQQFKPGDVIGAFNSNGLCAGYTLISETGTAIMIYADDPTTPEVDGMIEGEQISYRIFSAATGEKQLTGVQSGDDALNDCNYFTINGISMLELKTGVEDALVTRAVEIYPNPATDFLNIRFKSLPGQNSGIRITDIVGNTMIQTRPTSQVTTIEVSQLAAGCYLVHITNNNQTTSKKIVIRK